MNKYHNQETTIDRHVFSSKKEADYYQQLRLQMRATDNNLRVVKIELQPEFVLQDRFRKKGKTYRPIKYIADFKVWYADGREEIVDVKGGFKTSVFALKHKLFEHKYPKLTLVVI